MILPNFDQFFLGKPFGFWAADGGNGGLDDEKERSE